MTPVRGRWFPVAAVLPGEHRPWQRVYAVAADDGLHLYTRPSEDADWYSPVEWARTRLPENDDQARWGWDVHTDAGLVVLTLGTGCRCGHLGRWQGPAWVWADTVRA